MQPQPTPLEWLVLALLCLVGVALIINPQAYLREGKRYGPKAKWIQPYMIIPSPSVVRLIGFVLLAISLTCL